MKQNVNNTHHDVVIVGGGLVGLTLAAALAHFQPDFSIMLVESQALLLNWESGDKAAQVSALNQSTLHIFDHLNIWPQVRSPAFSPFRQLHVWDAMGGGEIAFDCAEIGVPQLGVIVENRELKRVLWQYLETVESVQLCAPCQVKELTVSDEKVALSLEGGRKVNASLVVGADGAHSWLRKQMGVAVREKTYDQSAVVCVVRLEKPHQETAWQPFTATGPLGLLPLANPHEAVVVWSVETARAQVLSAMDREKLGIEVTHALGGRLGAVSVLTSPLQFPLIARHASQYVGPRFALVGDAAHTIHPLAGQGVNLGLMDTVCLAESLSDACDQGRALGGLRALRRYERWRQLDNKMMQAAMRSFKELFGHRSSTMVGMRSQGLTLTNQWQGIKNLLMRYMMGESVVNSDLPKLALPVPVSRGSIV